MPTENVASYTKYLVSNYLSYLSAYQLNLIFDFLNWYLEILKDGSHKNRTARFLIAVAIPPPSDFK